MNNYNTLKSLPFHEFSEWLDKHCSLEDAPWMNWFNEKYCMQCPEIMIHDKINHTSSYSWCEKNKGCYFFPNCINDEFPSSKEILKLWLIEGN